MNKQLKAATDAVETARSAEINAYEPFNAAEREHGIGSDAARKVQAETVDPAQGLVDETERDLMNAPVKTMAEVLRKVAALLHDRINEDAIERIQEDIQSVLIEDPLTGLCARWKRIHRAEQAMLKNDTAGWFETPELVDMRQAKREIEVQIMDHMPRTPEALASLVDMYWITDGPASLTGSEGWEHEMNNPTNRLLAHIRRGAAHIAGLDRG